MLNPSVSLKVPDVTPAAPLSAPATGIAGNSFDLDRKNATAFRVAASNASQVSDVS